MEGSTSEASVESTQSSTESDIGCGCKISSSNSITVSVTPTTGGQFDLSITRNDTIENLKKLISKKLKVPKERICLLHRERQLRDGTVQDNQLVDGSRLTLLPSVETGLLAQRPEQSVMQALESLNDSQVNDFLSGKAPLNLTMRLGDHMMLIQLQLSTVAPPSSSSKRATTVKATPSTSGDPLASLTSIVNKSMETTSCSSSKLKEKQVSNGQRSFLTLLDSPKPESEVPLCTPEDLAKSSDDAVATSSFVPVPKATESSDSGVTMDVDGSIVTGGACKCEGSNPQRDSTAAGKPMLDTRALAEASRNLTQTLKQLSSEVLTSKVDPVEDTVGYKRRQGAIIESMQHHGKGVYSGTFSGTLNPALQDRYGRPKRDISTIIHILNDLLCATPQYRNAARISPAIVAEKPVPTQSSSTQTQSELLSVPNTVSDSVQNQATRDKMERLRLVMEERRERRRAARSRPYTRSPPPPPTQWCATSETQLPMDSDLCSELDVSPEPVIA